MKFNSGFKGLITSGATPLLPPYVFIVWAQQRDFIRKWNSFLLLDSRISKCQVAVVAHLETCSWTTRVKLRKHQNSRCPELGFETGNSQIPVRNVTAPNSLICHRWLLNTRPRDCCSRFRMLKRIPMGGELGTVRYRVFSNTYGKVKVTLDRPRRPRRR